MASAIIDDGGELARVLVAAIGRRGHGLDRNTYFVICERVSVLLAHAGVDSNWLPLRPRELPGSSLLRADAIQGTLLNEAAEEVRAIARAIDANDPRATVALRELGAHAWVEWRRTQPWGTVADFTHGLSRFLKAGEQDEV